MSQQQPSDQIAAALESLKSSILKQANDAIAQVEAIRSEYLKSKGQKKPLMDPAKLDALPWKPFPTGNGYWAFLTDPDDKILPEIEPVKDFIEALKTKSELVVGSWRYKISKDKFLNRFPVSR